MTFLNSASPTSIFMVLIIAQEDEDYLQTDSDHDEHGTVDINIFKSS